MTRPLDPGTIKLDGIQLIEASAGTGKTYTITQLYIRLLVEEKLDIENILVVTFTEAATAELRDRIRMKLREARTAFEKKEGDEFYTALFERVDAKKGWDGGELLAFRPSSRPAGVNLKKCSGRLMDDWASSAKSPSSSSNHFSSEAFRYLLRFRPVSS